MSARLGRAAAVNLGAGAIGATVNLLIAVVVGRHLGVEGAGSYFLVVAVFMIAANTVELGADTGLVRFVSAARAVGTPAQIPSLLRSALRPVLVAVVLLALAGAAVALAVEEPVPGVSPSLLVVASAVAGALALTAVLLGLIRGYDDAITFPVLQSLVLPTGRLVAIGLAVLAGWGVNGLLAAWLSPVPLILVLAAAVAWRLLRGTPRAPGSVDRRSTGAAFWRFSAARGVTACVETLLEWIDVILVGALTSPAEAGIYAVVTRCVRASEVVQQAGRIIVGPLISGALARGDLDRARDAYGVVTAAMVWLSWPFFILLAVFGDQVLRLFGSGFEDGAVAMSVLAIAMALATAAGTVQTILLMGGRSTWQLADKTGALVLNVALDLLLIPVWGITGAAIAWAITIIIDTVIVLWQVGGLMGMRPSGRHLEVAMAMPLVLVAAPALVARAVFGSSMPTAVFTALGAGALYVAVGWLARRRLGLTRLVEMRASAVHSR